MDSIMDSRLPPHLNVPHDVSRERKTFHLNATSAVIPWHVSEIAQTSFITNPAACPILDDIKRTYEASPAYTTWLHSKQDIVRATAHLFASSSASVAAPSDIHNPPTTTPAIRHHRLPQHENTTHDYDEKTLFDCLLTARCSMPSTTSWLPREMTPALFQDIITFEREKRMKIFLEAPQYAKRGLAKVIRAMRNRIVARTAILQGDTHATTNGPRFALYSGMDLSILYFDHYI